MTTTDASLRILTVMALGLATGCLDIEAIESPAPLASLPAHEQARVELGQRLFFDGGLSADGTVACASCHVLTEGGDDGRAVSRGVGAREGRRNAPTVLNVGLKTHLFWDGRADTLEQQCLGPLRAKDEMAAEDARVLAYLEGDEAYRTAFADAFPGGGVTLGNMTRAVAAYERRLVTPSRVDAFLLGDESALDAKEQRGMEFFRGNCAFCHDGPGFGGRRYAKLGDDVPWPADRSGDRGLYDLTGDPDDDMVFVVPQLRNVARTAPYFHDGSVPTLEEAVRLMGRHQLGRELSRTEITDVVAFLEAASADPEPELLVPPEKSSPLPH